MCDVNNSCLWVVLITYVNGVSIVLKALKVLFVMCMIVRDRLPGGLCMSRVTEI